MTSAEDVDSYLIRMGATYDVVADNIWLVRDPTSDVVVSIAGPIVVFRVKVIEVAQVPAQNRERFFQSLLELNASEMLHGAYGLEEGSVVATGALQLENLDFNEFQATLEDLGLAVSKHYPVLKQLAS